MKHTKYSSMAMAAVLLAGCSASAATTTKSTTSTDDSAVTTAANHSAVTTSVSLDEEDTVETWDDSAAVKVTLNDNSASFTGTGISETGSVINISQSGTYVFSGSYAGRIVVNTTSRKQYASFSTVQRLHLPTTVPLK